MAIPKTIHYCWFGKGQKSELAEKCIKSWKEYCKDYQIKEWNEENFDINSNEYVRQAYEAKKYAFVTDYVRLYALYTEGGIYMDTDVEVLKPLDAFLNHKAFSSFENNNMIPTGILAGEKENIWIKDLLDEYTNLKFLDKNGKMDLTTNVVRITNLTKQKYDLKLESSFQELKDGIVTIYPFDYFCPKDWETGNINLTDNTHAIHHFAGSWHTDKEKKRNEKSKLKLAKYIKKYGEVKGKKIFKTRQNIVYVVMHPIFAIKRIIKKIKEGKIKNEI